MAAQSFDFERLRRNWERAAEPPREELPARLAAVETPRNPYLEARALFERIRVLAMERFPDRSATLAPFFAEGSRLLILIENPKVDSSAAEAGGVDGSEMVQGQGSDAGDEGEEKPPRARLEALFNELTELLEVFETIG
jgi:hypothetical protein